MGLLTKIGSFLRDEWRELDTTSDQAFSEASDYFKKNGLIPIEDSVDDFLKAKLWLEKKFCSPNRCGPTVLARLVEEASETWGKDAIYSLVKLAKSGDEEGISALSIVAKVNPAGVFALDRLFKTEINNLYRLYFADALATLNINSLAALVDQQVTALADKHGTECLSKVAVDFDDERDEFANLTGLRALAVLAEHGNPMARREIHNYLLPRLLELAQSSRGDNPNKLKGPCKDSSDFSRHRAIVALKVLADGGNKKAQESLKKLSLSPFLDSFYDVDVTFDWKIQTVKVFKILILAGHPQALLMLTNLANVSDSLVRSALTDLSGQGHVGAKKALNDLPSKPSPLKNKRVDSIDFGNED